MEPQLQTTSPELCQVLFAETTEGIFISDAQGHLLEVNPQACEWLGYSRAELLHLSWQDLLPVEDSGLGLPSLAERKNGQTIRTRSQLRDKNGRSFTGEIRLRGLADGRRVTFVRNLGEYRPTEETPHPYALLADHSRDIILILSYNDGRIVDANTTATEIYGYSREELLSLSIRDLRAPEVHALTAAHMDQAHAQGTLFETLHRRKDGSTFPVEVNSKGTILNDISVLISVVRDISERKQAKRERHIALEKYRVLFETFPLGISLTDERGNLIEVNGESERLLGLARQDHIGRTYDDPEWRIVRPDGTLMPPDEYASVRALKEKRLVENVEMGMVKDGGEITWLNVTAAPIPLDGYGVAIAYGDITERKQMEAERQAHLRFFTSMDQVNRAIQEANDLEQMMSDVLDALLVIFECDRAWLVYSCDPEAATW